MRCALKLLCVALLGVSIACAEGSRADAQPRAAPQPESDAVLPADPPQASAPQETTARDAAPAAVDRASSLRDLFPARFHGTTFLLADYQWIALAILFVLGLVADVVTQSVLRHLTSAWFRFARSDGERRLERSVWRPVGLLAQALVWYQGIPYIGLPGPVLGLALVALKFFAVVAAVWTGSRLIDLLASYLTDKAQLTATRFDDLLVPLISKSLKVLAAVIGVLICAEAFRLPIAGLLGGLGLGGAALALASKDTIANLFGSLTVLVDRPFEIGDWVSTSGVEGSVEAVGFRSTRIRTPQDSLITLPNSLLTTAVVDNVGRRRYRRLQTTLGLEYGTRPEQIEAFCEGVRELIRRHPYTRKDNYQVYLNDFGDSALNILVTCFLECPDGATELRERERLLMGIVRLADALGCAFAFPTRTLHLFQETPSDKPPEKLSAPERAGQKLAAEIAGPLLSTADRPGPVQFSGPTDIENQRKNPR
jgi:MscS family membrane protein